MTHQQVESITHRARMLAFLVCFMAVAGFWLLSAAGCSGGGHSAEAAALLAPVVPVAAAPPTGNTTATPCPVGSVGEYPDCTAPTPAAPAAPPPVTCWDGSTAQNQAQCPAQPFNSTVYTCPGGGTSQTLNGCPPVAPAAPIPPTAPTSPVVIPPNPSALPPTMTLIAAPNPVAAGSSAVLTWASTLAGACYGTAGWPSSDVVTPNGFTATGALTVATSYELVCNGAGGNATASVTVAVTSASVPTPPPVTPPVTPPVAPPVAPPPTPPPVTPPPPVACALPFCMALTPTIVNSDGGVFFTWSSTALECDVSGAGSAAEPAMDFGMQGGSGATEVAPLSGAAVWTLTCDNGGAPYQSTSVTVSP